MMKEFKINNFNNNNKVKELENFRYQDFLKVYGDGNNSKKI